VKPTLLGGQREAFIGKKERSPFKGKTLKVGKAFAGYPVGLKPSSTDGLFDVLFCHHTVRQINLKEF
jgi:hypothetical protein